MTDNVAKTQNETISPVEEGASENLAFLRSGESFPSEKVYSDRSVLIEIKEHGVTTWMLAGAPETLPSGVVTDQHVDAALLRRHFRQTQEGMAALLGVSVQTWRNWESGRRAPRGPALNLLKVAAGNPTVLLEADLQLT